jgi:hypothetical protein
MLWTPEKEINVRKQIQPSAALLERQGNIPYSWRNRLLTSGDPNPYFSNTSTPPSDKNLNYVYALDRSFIAKFRYCQPKVQKPQTSTADAACNENPQIFK